MSIFKVNVTARNPKREEMVTQPLEALVDTGSELTWLPADVLTGVGITPRRKRIFTTATQQKIEREVGYAILSAEGYETNDEVVFAEPGDMTLLGVRTLEGFGVMVDNIGHRFVARHRMVTSRRRESDSSAMSLPSNGMVPVGKLDVASTPRSGSDVLQTAWPIPRASSRVVASQALSSRAMTAALPSGAMSDRICGTEWLPPPEQPKCFWLRRGRRWCAPVSARGDKRAPTG